MNDISAGFFPNRRSSCIRSVRRRWTGFWPATRPQAAKDWAARGLERSCGSNVPIQGEVWNEERVGFLEADSVAHCGGSLAGDFIWSLTYTDLCCSWTEGRAVWNKGSTGVLEQTPDVEGELPFAILGFDFDNGSEWLNWTLIRHLQERPKPIRLTRSPPYHKDDNAHVEQKNWMWPRQLLGHGRLGQAELVEPIKCTLQRSLGTVAQLFPALDEARQKMARKAGRWVRRYDKAQTAYQRLLASGQLNRPQSVRLRDWYESLDPLSSHKIRNDG
jgi:hypothetical protein